MSKKKKKSITGQQDETVVEDYYDLKTDAVDRLVNASADTAPEIGEDQPDPYKSGFLSHVPTWIKALFIKFWFNGAVCFFFLWGLGTYITDYMVLVLVLGIAQGIVTDILVNNLFRFLQTDEHEYDKWMLLPQKAFWTFFANIIYALALIVCVVLLYNGINTLIIYVQNLSEDSVPLGVEPILYGLFYLAFDLIFIGIKNMIVHLVRKAKNG